MDSASEISLSPEGRTWSESSARKATTLLIIGAAAIRDELVELCEVSKDHLDSKTSVRTGVADKVGVDAS